MSDTFMRVEEVANELGVSKAYAYKLVQKLLRELLKFQFWEIYILTTGCVLLMKNK